MVDGLFDQVVTMRGEGDGDGSAVGARTGAFDQSGGLGAGQSLGDRASADQTAGGQLAGGQLIRRSTASQDAEQVEDRGVDARVVQDPSSAALRGSGGGPYGAMKAALHGFMYDLARGVGSFGGTANVIAPGFVPARYR